VARDGEGGRREKKGRKEGRGERGGKERGEGGERGGRREGREERGEGGEREGRREGRKERREGGGKGRGGREGRKGREGRVKGQREGIKEGGMGIMTKYANSNSQQQAFWNLYSFVTICYLAY